MTGSSLPLEQDRPPRRRSIRLWWRTWEWLVIGVAALVGLVLGYIGTWLYFRDAPAWHRHPWEVFYRTIQLLPLQFGWFDKPLHWTLQVARLLLPALAVYAAFKGLAALYVEQLQALNVRLFARNHTIICGLGQKGLLLARRLREQGRRVVVIELDAENDLIRPARAIGCVVLVGDATEPYMLNKAVISRARHLVTVCRDDGMNAQIAVTAEKLVDRHGGNLRCACHIFDSHLEKLLRTQAPRTEAGRSFRLEFRNIYEEGAARLVELDACFASGKPGAGHNAVVVGIGRMGESLLLGLAERWQKQRGDSREPLRITMVDIAAQAKLRYLLSEYPQYAGVWELTPVEIDITSPDFRRVDFLPGAHAVQRVYVCLDDDSLGLTAALRIQEKLRQNGQHVPIVVRTRHNRGLARLVEGIDSRECLPNCVLAFALHEHTCEPGLWFDHDTGQDEKGTPL